MASKMHMGIQMRTGHLFWAKDRWTCDRVCFKPILDEYWSSAKLEFTVPSQLRLPTSRSFLIVRCRSSYHSKLSLVSGIAIRCKHYCSYPCNCPSKPADHACIGGTSTLATQWTRGIVEGILPADKWIDGDDCREAYWIRGRIPRGQFSHMEIKPTSDWHPLVEPNHEGRLWYR